MHGFAAAWVLMGFILKEILQASRFLLFGHSLALKRVSMDQPNTVWERGGGGIGVKQGCGGGLSLLQKDPMYMCC